MYSYTKRFTSFAHIFLGLSLGLAPLAGDIAISMDIHLWSIILFFSVMFWVAGFDILYSLQDINFDKQEGLYSIPSKYGIKKSFIIVHIFHIITSILWILFAYIVSLGYIAYFGISFAIFLLIYENKIAREDMKNINKAFFTINGYIAILFFISIFIDIMYLG
jgi:4-hydroxybenzoate polyprenyltransferase